MASRTTPDLPLKRVTITPSLPQRKHFRRALQGRFPARGLRDFVAASFDLPALRTLGASLVALANLGSSATDEDLVRGDATRALLVTSFLRRGFLVNGGFFIG